MKSIKITLSLLALFACSLSVNAEDSYSFGVGLGTAYSGIGVNVAQVSQDDMKYASAGCVSTSSIYGSTCGVGVGWITTDLLDAESNKIGLGAYLGIVGRKRDGITFEHEASYGVGIGYHYFFNGIDQPGTRLGFSFVVGADSDDNSDGLLLELGYQF